MIKNIPSKPKENRHSYISFGPRDVRQRERVGIKNTHMMISHVFIMTKVNAPRGHNSSNFYARENISSKSIKYILTKLQK